MKKCSRRTNAELMHMHMRVHMHAHAPAESLPTFSLQHNQPSLKYLIILVKRLRPKTALMDLYFLQIFQGF